jgi:hypothetical protein
MMFFLKERVEALRDHIDPDCGVILIHHTKKLSKHQVKEDPFLALSGASALRGFYTSGLLMHRPDEDSTVRKLEIELRNGPALAGKLIDKVKGEWVELNPMNERLVRKEVGAKLDAERLRKGDVILTILHEEAAAGRLYTTTQFGEAFENKAGLGSKYTIRDRVGKPLIVRSAYRSPEHNRAVGGATRSKHLDGAAFDIAMANHDPVAFEAAAREVGFLGFGFYPRSGFMHVDLGPARQWGERFPVRATAFAAETPPAREVLAESRTMKGGGAAGVATLGVAGVEVAQSVLAETQTAILPLVPYLDTLRWVFIAVALGGIAITIYARLDDWRWGRR